MLFQTLHEKQKFDLTIDAGYAGRVYRKIYKVIKK